MPPTLTTNLSSKPSISVIMIDGSFRENAFSADTMSGQELPSESYEIIWVEFYQRAHPAPVNLPKVKVVCLDHPADTTYHSSVCFNAGIRAAQGDIVVVTDADQIFPTDFLGRVEKIHAESAELVSYAYRYDEPHRGALNNHTVEHLEQTCVYKNTLNYGACMSVRKRWLEKINGYEEHEIFATGFHANGLDIYTRFRNFGLPIQWHPELKVYHPWHNSTLTYAPQYELQHEWIKWRTRKRQYMALRGLAKERDAETTLDANSRALLERLTERSMQSRSQAARTSGRHQLLRRAARKFISSIATRYR